MPSPLEMQANILCIVLHRVANAFGALNLAVIVPLRVREAMGIVHSKILGGANPYGSGRGLLDVGKGAYRYAVWCCCIHCI